MAGGVAMGETTRSGGGRGRWGSLGGEVSCCWAAFHRALGAPTMCSVDSDRGSRGGDSEGAR